MIFYNTHRLLPNPIVFKVASQAIGGNRCRDPEANIREILGNLVEEEGQRIIGVRKTEKTAKKSHPTTHRIN